MAQKLLQIINDYQTKLEEIKKTSIQLTDEYNESKEKVLHHITLCKLKHKPVNMNIIAAYPDVGKYIGAMSKLQNEIIRLRNENLHLLDTSENKNYASTT